jgi:hypothetical protein
MEWDRCNETTIFRARMTAWRYELRYVERIYLEDMSGRAAL